MINKRYKDIFEQYIHKGEATPLTIGTLAVCALCFLILIVATFSQINLAHPWFQHVSNQGFSYITKHISYNPQIVAMLFVIYILGKNYSLFVFSLYLLTGFFFLPIFAFGGGLSYIQNYLFGYLLGYIFAILITGTILKLSQSIKARLLGALLGVLAIHICGFIYCFILAIFKVIDFNLIIPIFKVMSASKIIYDIILSSLVFLVAPYIKNVLWICMKPKYSSKNKSKNSRKRNQIVSDDIYQHG